jgi:hypothetical protein
MVQTAYHGVVRDGVVLLEPGTPFVEGTEVLVTSIGARDSGAALVAAMDKAPKVPREWVDELEQLIAVGQGVPSPPIEFPDESPSQENG